MNLIKRISHISGVLFRGVKRLPENLKTPEAPFQTDPLVPGTTQVAIYFADDEVNLYQLRQWYKPLEQLHRVIPVAIFTRLHKTAELLTQECSLPISQYNSIADIEIELRKQPLKIVLYVNQNMRNFQMLRFGHVNHIFINHGESDKSYMSSNQLKAYDYTFVAGQAATDRLEKSLKGYNTSLRTVRIGRPQTDYFWEEAAYPIDERINVLYAPTWEGDRPSMRYGSLESHGLKLATILLSNSKYRLIYRPHPRTGIASKSYGLVHNEIVGLLNAANKSNPEANHIYDTSSEVSWQISQPEVVITDISAMLYDRLSVGKPLLVTRPESEQAVINGNYLKECEWLERTDDFEQNIAHVLNDKQSLRNLKSWSDYYFDKFKPSNTERFLNVIQEIAGRKPVE